VDQVRGRFGTESLNRARALAPRPQGSGKHGQN
jgi:hypothetical protein